MWVLWIVGWLVTLYAAYWFGRDIGRVEGGGIEERKRWKQFDEMQEQLERAESPAILHFVDPALVEAAERVHKEQHG
jgi:hypothetical protein